MCTPGVVARTSPRCPQLLASQPARRGRGYVIRAEACVSSVCNVSMLLLVLAACLCVATCTTKNTLVLKCCKEERCLQLNESGAEPWTPDLSAFTFLLGSPQCGTRQPWKIYHDPNASDWLQLLESGYLRHTTVDPGKAHGDHDDDDGHRTRYHDYEPGSYCIDKALEPQYAEVCAPEVVSPWNGTDWVVRRIVDPVCHGLAIACYQLVAVVYFVVPQLRDLVGNMLTTIAVCLSVSQAADLVRIFTEFSSHVSFMVADVAMYMSLLGAFFWLNSLGYYIWKTFRSRNVFLRVTDGRKYCYYSCYSWGATLTMGGIALFAHFLLDTDNPITPTGTTPLMQKTIGWLGIAVFFTPVAFTILVNIFFYLTTGQAISRISTYGRIHHKMKYSFEMFVKLFLVMAVAWLFLLLSWLRYDAVVYCHIAVNALQAFFFLYITICGQERVTTLLRQVCCSSDQSGEADWGEEMNAMNTSHY